jgi:PadR family transcriptional regulator, regulatory protein AphA
MRGKLNPFRSSEYVLLGLLFEKPTHGYELHKLVADPEGIGLVWLVKMSNLYAQLDKLEAKGYITGIIQPGDAHPNRTEYHITSDGKTAFEVWLNTMVKHPRDFRQEFMARYYYVIKFFPSKVVQLCQNQLQECNAWLSNIQTSEQQAKNGPFFKRSVIEFRRMQIQAIIHWLEAIQGQH